jgi:hypothetical protein
MIPPGEHKARAISASLEEYGSEGRVRVWVQFQLSEMAETIVWYGYFQGKDEETTERLKERTVQSLRHCGWQGYDLEDLTGISEKEVNLVVRHELYNGKTVVKVAWVNPVRAVITPQVKTAKLKEFAAAMRSTIAAVDTADRKPKPRQLRPVGRPMESIGDVPLEVLEAQANSEVPSDEDSPFL